MRAVVMPPRLPRSHDLEPSPGHASWAGSHQVGRPWNPAVARTSSLAPGQRVRRSSARSPAGSIRSQARGAAAVAERPAVSMVARTRWRSDADRYCSRSEEHTSELQSLMRISYAVFCLKKKNKRSDPNGLHQAKIKENND